LPASSSCIARAPYTSHLRFLVFEHGRDTLGLSHSGTASVPYRLESLAAILKCGVPVLTLAPHSLADVYQDILLLGSLLHVPERAEAVIADMVAEFDTTRRIAGASDAPLVHCEEWGKPIIHAQPWVAEMVASAGGRFLGTPGAVTDAASIAAHDPEVLIFSWCGAGDRVPLGRVVEERQWQSLRAVRTGRVYCIPDDFLNTPAPNLLQGLRALAGAIHPETFRPVETVQNLQTDAGGREKSKIV
jgi:iron complex transport system substrate-binding protein